MWTKEHILQLGQGNKARLLITCLSSTLVGAATSHLVTKKILEKKYEERSTQEIEDAKLFFQQLNKTGAYSDPSVLAEKYADVPIVFPDQDIPEGETQFVEPHPKAEKKEISSPDPGESMEEFEERLVHEAADHVRELKYHTSLADLKASKGDEALAKKSINKNIFQDHAPVDDEDDEFDIAVEEENRNSGNPYIITHDEFYENEPENSQTSLTYFEGDNVLMEDLSSAPIRDIKGAIGADTLKFGYGSKDENIVYIRNEGRSADFEVARSNGHYSREVLGMEQENSLEHSDRPRVRKMRDRDL